MFSDETVLENKGGAYITEALIILERFEKRY